MDWARAMEVPPVPVAASFFSAAAAMARALAPLGSQLAKISPSTFPASMSPAIFSSSRTASRFTSSKVPRKMTRGCSPSQVHNAALVSGLAVSMEASAAMNWMAASWMSAALICRTISPSRDSGSLPPRLYRFPPLLPKIAAAFAICMTPSEIETVRLPQPDRSVVLLYSASVLKYRDPVKMRLPQQQNSPFTRSTGSILPGTDDAP